MYDSRRDVPFASISCSSVSPCSPFFSASLSLFLFSLIFHSAFSPPLFPSARTIDVSILVGWCSLAFATVSACSKSAGVVCPAVLFVSPPRPPFSLFTPDPPSLFSASSSLSSIDTSPPRLKINGSSARGRARVNPRRSKSTRVKNRGIIGLLVFDLSHIAHA